MPEPYVPSGKEFDEGIEAKPAPTSRIRRQLERLRPRRIGRSKVHELKTLLPDGVGERVPGRHSKASDQPAANEVPQTESLAVVPERPMGDARPVVASTGPERATSKQDERPLQMTAFGVADSLDLSPATWIAILCADGDVALNETRTTLEDVATDPRTQAELVELISWLLDVTDPSTSSRPGSHASALGPEVESVLRYVNGLAGRDRLSEYSALLLRRRALQDAIRELERVVVGYPTLNGLVNDLKIGKLRANWIQNAGGIYSAAYQMCQQQLGRAIAAYEAVGEAMSCPILPRGVASALEKSAKLVALGVLNRIADQPSITRPIGLARSELSASVAFDSSRLSVVERFGISVAPAKPPRGAAGGRNPRDLNAHRP